MHSSQSTAIIVALLTAFGCLFSSEPLVLLLVGATLIIGLLLLWTEGNIPMLLMPFLLQWLSVATKPISAAITGVQLNQLAEFGSDIAGAATFASLALIALAIGMRVGMIGNNTNLVRSLQADLPNWPQSSVAGVGLSLVAVGHFMTAISIFVAGLREILLALGNLTYCGLFLLVYYSLRTGRLPILVSCLVLVEILFGMTGFFGLFRTTLFTVAVAAMCARPQLKIGTALIGTAIAVPALFLMVFWTVVKTDYRDLMNSGSQTQSVSQPLEVRLAFLSDRAQQFDGDQFEAGFGRLMDRMSYIDFLSMTLAYVPINMPHENGQRTFESMIHIFTPRIIFTSKPPLESDTVVTARYTGRAFTNYTYASISIGYLGEAYIDYGWLGAILFTFVFGMVMGRLVMFVLAYRPLPVTLNAGMALMVTIPMWYFETALIKTIGGTIASFLAVLLLQRFVFPSMLSKYTSVGRGGPVIHQTPLAQGT